MNVLSVAGVFTSLYDCEFTGDKTKEIMGNETEMVNINRKWKQNYGN